MEKEESASFELVKLIPNMITLSSLCVGLLSVRMAIVSDFVSSLHCIIIACLCDGFDGNVARKLNAASDFGAQLDSLSDFFCFGIAPGFVVYFWNMQYFDTYKRIAWIPVLLLAACMAIRLARFNVALNNEDKENPLNKYFFKGIPAPMAAALVMLPMVISFEFDIKIEPVYVIINTIIIALMAGSTIPTPCFKKIKFKDTQKQFLLIIIALFLIGLLIKTLFTATLICLLYIVSIFFSWIFYIKFKRNLDNSQNE